jgi:hypothetical protein
VLNLKTKKGVQQLVSVVIIITIALGTIALVLPWTLLMVQKKKDMKTLDDVYNFFQKLDETIIYVEKHQGEESLTLRTPGKFTVYPESLADENNNSIVFEFQSKVSNVAQDVWVPLNTPNTNETATLGIDPPSIIFAKAERSGDDIKIWYKLRYRELDDQSGNGYKIILNTTDNSEKSTITGFLRIQWLNSRDVVVGSKTLTITEINILV